MKIPFEEMADTVVTGMHQGQGQASSRVYQDRDNKIMRGCLFPGSSIGPHTHQQNSEIVYILSGTGKVLCDGETEQLGPGSCHYCPRGHSHSVINDGGEDLCFFSVIPEHGA